MVDLILVAAAGVLVAVGGVIVVARSRRDAVAGLTVYLAIVMLLPSRFVLPAMGGAGTPAVLIGLGLAIWWMAARALPKLGLPPRGEPISPVILLFAGSMLVAYALGFLRPLSELAVNGADRSVIILVSVVGPALMAAQGVPSLDRLKVLLERLTTIGALVASVGVLQFIGFDPVQYLRIPGLVLNAELESVLSRSLFARPAGTALHAIEFGVVLGMLLPLAIQQGLESQAYRWVRWVRVGVIALALPMSVSRSAIVVVVIGLLVLGATWSTRERLNIAAVTVLFLGATRAVFPGLLGTVRSLFTGAQTDPSITGRTEDVGPVYDLFAQSPVFGIGFGTFSPEEYRFLDNQLFESLIETGVVGLFFLIFLMAGGIVTAMGAARRNPEHRSVTFALAGGILGGLVGMFTFDGFSFPSFYALLFILVGCGGSYWRLLRQVAPGPSGLPIDPTSLAERVLRRREVAPNA